MYTVSSSLPLFRWRLTITRTMKKPWMLCPRRTSASRRQKILHLPNKKRDWLTCSTKSPSSRSLSKLAGKQRKSHFSCVVFLNECLSVALEESLSLCPPNPPSKAVCWGCRWGGAAVWGLTGRAGLGPCCQDWRRVQLRGGTPLPARQLPSGKHCFHVLCIEVEQEESGDVWLALRIFFFFFVWLLVFVLLVQAYRKLEELQKLLPSQNIRYYISQASLEALQREMGVPIYRQDNRLGGKEEDEVEEDLSVS